MPLEHLVAEKMDNHVGLNFDPNLRNLLHPFFRMRYASPLEYRQQRVPQLSIAKVRCFFKGPVVHDFFVVTFFCVGG